MDVVEKTDRLVRLLSLVNWQANKHVYPTGEPSTQEEFRQAVEEGRVRTYIEALKTQQQSASGTLTKVAMFIHGADRWVHGSTERTRRGDAEDARQLHDFALEAAVKLEQEGQLELVGSWVQTYVGSTLDASDVGRMWLDDVKRVAWELQVHSTSEWALLDAGVRTSVDREA